MREPQASTPWLSHTGKLIVACAVHLACVLSLVAAAIDFLAMSMHDVALTTKICAALTSLALGAWVALPLSAFAAALTLLARAMLAHKLLRFLWLVPGLVIASGFMWSIMTPLARKDPGPYMVLCALASLAIAAVQWLSRRKPVWLARGAILAIAAGAIAVDLGVGSYWYIELHDASDLISVAAILAASMPLRERVLHASTRATLAALASLIVLPGAVLAGVMHYDRQWRNPDIIHAQNLRRQTRVLGKLSDRDGDGFSPIFWGGDCNDSNPDIHPGALEPVGNGDQNCNGVDRKRSHGIEERGLAPAFGDPVYAKGTLDRVVLVTFDTWRADTFNANAMPKLTALARSGLRFSRAYPGGSHTKISVPQWFQASIDANDVLGDWSKEDIRTVAVIDSAYVNVFLSRQFENETHPTSTQETTERGLAAIEDSMHGGRHFIWIHYFELHQPSSKPGAFVPSEPASTSNAYRETAFRIDAGAARLIERLRAPDSAERTLIILTGDHGEGFGEHFVYAHGASGYDTVIHVPLVVWGPGIGPGTYDHVVSTRGMTATLHGAFGLTDSSLRSEIFGRSLLRLRNDRSLPLQDFVVVYSNRFTSGAKSHVSLGVLVDDRYKAVWGIEDDFIELYEHASDPNELNNLAAERPDLVRERIAKGSVVLDMDDYPKAYPH